MAYLYNVSCMMCGRASGQIRGGVFHKLPTAPTLVVRGGRSRCGFCSGNIYLEAEDSPIALAPIASIDARQARRAS